VQEKSDTCVKFLGPIIVVANKYHWPPLNSVLYSLLSGCLLEVSLSNQTLPYISKIASEGVEAFLIYIFLALEACCSALCDQLEQMQYMQPPCISVMIRGSR
jgi:hypothetical protein